MNIILTVIPYLAAHISSSVYRYHDMLHVFIISPTFKLKSSLFIAWLHYSTRFQEERTLTHLYDRDTTAQAWGCVRHDIRKCQFHDILLIVNHRSIDFQLYRSAISIIRFGLIRSRSVSSLQFTAAYLLLSLVIACQVAIDQTPDQPGRLIIAQFLLEVRSRSCCIT